VSKKLKTLEDLKRITTQAQTAGKRVVLTNGCFDLLHRGHLHVLRSARELGDLLIVAMNSDTSVQQIKGPNRPIFPEADRTELIAAMEVVDYLLLFDEGDPHLLIEALKPDILVKGGDWKKDQVVGAEIVERHGGKVILVPYLEGYSTTEIIERIRKPNYG
jgi:D-beta-D-heptose 7-phosphate kinase/D-beta-D-heptose 1-phosphate adenosyltransferase